MSTGRLQWGRLLLSRTFVIGTEAAPSRQGVPPVHHLRRRQSRRIGHRRRETETLRYAVTALIDVSSGGRLQLSRSEPATGDRALSLSSTTAHARQAKVAAVTADCDAVHIATVNRAYNIHKIELVTTLPCWKSLGSSGYRSRLRTGPSWDSPHRHDHNRRNNNGHSNPAQSHHDASQHRHGHAGGAQRGGPAVNSITVFQPS